MKPVRIKRRFSLGLGGFTYLFVTSFIGLGAISSQTNLLFWTFGLMVGGMIVSAIYSTAMMMSLRITRVLPDHGAVDEPLLIRYELTNRKRMIPAFGLVISELDGDDEYLRGKPHGWVLHCGPRATLQAQTVGWPTRRGAVHFNRICITTTFPFGILSKSIVVTQPGRVLIYPKMYRLRRKALWDIHSRDMIGSRNSNEGGGSEEFYGLREYRSGDSMRHIDWRHSARAGKLVCRDMTRLTPPKLMLLLDVRHRGAWPYDTAERALSFVASLVVQAYMEGFDVGLAVAGTPCPTFTPHHGRIHRTRILHALGELDFKTDEPGSWSTHRARDVNWMVIHAGEIDELFGPPGAHHLSDAELDQWKLNHDGKSSRVNLVTRPRRGVLIADFSEGVS
ncbi:DUF58 domain-containing protein [Planctomycetales bacterium ZRK34]|nr:DUF58 domain-containing protein [Planctomycetales bacterium ZRK34]